MQAKLPVTATTGRLERKIIIDRRGHIASGMACCAPIPSSRSRPAAPLQ